MERSGTKSDIIEQLRKDILALEGFKPPSGQELPAINLGPITEAFPNHTFPIGAVHEFISPTAEDGAATTGFVSGLLGQLMQNGGTCLWIGVRRKLYPPSLKIFGIEPHKIIFLDLTREKDVLWAVEEALKCPALAAVVGELSELSFPDSRRLQLAVEQSHVTGFIHRVLPKSENTVACLSRWKISPIASTPEDGVPGMGLPRWNVRLVKIRNGIPGAWSIEWAKGKFRHIRKPSVAGALEIIRQTG